MYFIGIDVGTSGTKTILTDSKGNILATATFEYPLYQPQIGWAEQNPEDWWDASVKGIKAVLEKSKVDPKEVKAVGLTGQMHGLVMLDKNYNVIRPSIIWCDQRTAKECDEITQKVGKERLIEITANPALTGFTASKILWVKNNEPQNYEKVYKILLPKDYIRFKLTGEFATDVSDASGMQLLDIKNRCWSDEVLEKLEIDKDLLGKVYESPEVTGKVSRQASEITGLCEGTLVVAGGGDQAAGAVGNGIVKTGVISSTIGSSGVVFAHLDELKIDPQGRVHTFCHAVPGKWHVMGVTQGAGLSLKWFRDNFAHVEKAAFEFIDKDPYILMDQEAELANPGSDGLVFLPYLMGERTPILDPYAKGIFFGITAKHTRREFIRAVMEGVVFSLKNCLDILNEMGIEVKEVRVSGGGAKSKLWRQMQADIFEMDVWTLNSKEGPAFGAAILAAVGAGEYNKVEEACDVMIQKVESCNPNKDLFEVYRRTYKLYNSIYPRVKDLFNA
ncbi:xylulokinase [Caldicellulosiruptor bescii]|uniref:Xylulose kinase n=2 Tax=Caldicellulosiruptor bescii TaxID=31899 RepID=B9MPD2_CALBD|nr:xylulokinase [Caldicellulosiruptor bescii]ACM59693.1 xylulokinase [Caldicellulosiruptor bescii DSM 6725]PBC89718.1 xylulokinase [Caldicellulosiruptor bescii]PBC90041.1 xylulokinase [Caldicellulosiruptor bescii]PBD04528.1 xylulokinase [Caldicellulosiruptor bescii]PBD05838.1 xylulokinase [Caldicellulosiruptor bescii]